MTLRLDNFESFGYIGGATNPLTAGLVGQVPFVAVGIGPRGQNAAQWAPGDSQQTMQRGSAILSGDTWTVAAGRWNFGHAGMWSDAGQVFVYVQSEYDDMSLALGSGGTLELWEHLLDGYGPPTRVRYTSEAVLRSPDAWNFIEVYVQASSGADPITGESYPDAWIAVRVNGIQVMSYYGFRCLQPHPFIGNIRNVDGSASTSWMYLCDVYTSENDESEPMEKRCYGDAEVWCLRPTMSGTYSNWTQTGGSGSDYTCINDAAPDEDASYLEATITGNKSTFGMTHLVASSKAIASLTSYVRHRSDAVSSFQIKIGPELITAGTEYSSTGSSQNSSGTYAWRQIERKDTNPSTGIAWTTGEINAIEMGFNHSSLTDATHFIRITSFFAHVFRAGHLPLDRHGGAQVI